MEKIKNLRYLIDNGQILDDRHEIFSRYTSSCSLCKYFEEKYYACKAFPDGIPEKILSGENKHHKPEKSQSDNSIVFTPI